MSSPSPSLDISPPVHRLKPGEDLDPAAFTRSIPVLAARIHASQTTAMTRNNPIRGLLLNIPKIKAVVSDPESEENRLVLLRVSEPSHLTSEARNYLDAHSQNLVPYCVRLDYSYWTSDEILQSTLPAELLEESPTSFTITGHIAHFNLREEYLPWKHLIGRIVLDKHKNLRTVVNKLDNIDNEFRFFSMEVLAGEPDFIVDLSESNCRFRFDFSQVYWNSRLHPEHERLVKLFQSSDVVADVFAGVGPFAIPAAKKGCAIFGNDLNPNSAKYMQLNAVDNRVESRIRVSCTDGREFIRDVAKNSWDSPFPSIDWPLKTPRQLQREERHRRNVAMAANNSSNNHSQDTEQPSPEEMSSTSTQHTPSPGVRRRIDHFVMNLPGTAIEFLNAFRGCLSSIKDEPGFTDIYKTMPLVHCHSFTRELEPEKAKADLRQRAEDSLGGVITGEIAYHFVRSVAPKKDMWCITFTLPRDLALS